MKVLEEKEGSRMEVSVEYRRTPELAAVFPPREPMLIRNSSPLLIEASCSALLCFPQMTKSHSVICCLPSAPNNGQSLVRTT